MEICWYVHIYAQVIIPSSVWLFLYVVQGGWEQGE